MNTNGSGKSENLSDKLNEALDGLQDTSVSFSKIELVVNSQYELIQKKLNPDSNNDITKEIRFQFSHYLKNLSKDFE
jgi:hypothetical protein